MEIMLNGKASTVSDGTTVSALLEEHRLKTEEVVVEINHAIVERKHFDTTRFSAGDNIEILYFVGGG